MQPVGCRSRAATGTAAPTAPAPAARQRRRRAAPGSTPSRIGLPANSLSRPSMRPAYCERIQSSLKRLGTRNDTTAPESLSLMSAGGNGRIQVLNCCSGSSAARRSQPRCQRSTLIVDKFFSERRDCRSLHSRQARLSTVRGRPSMPAPRRGLPCKCLTRQGVFALIRDFPDSLKNRCVSALRQGHATEGKARLAGARRADPSCTIRHHFLVVMAPASSLAHGGPYSDETHLSALQGSPRPHARFSRPHENARRPRRAQRQASQGPQAPVVGLSRDARPCHFRCSAACGVRPISSPCWRHRSRREALTSRRTIWRVTRSGSAGAAEGDAHDRVIHRRSRPLPTACG